MEKQPIKPGGHFYTSWGYDQTNIDYLTVVELSPSGKSAKCRMVHAVRVGSQGTEDVVMFGTPYGEPFTMRIQDDGVLRGSYPYCNGSKRLDWFWPTKQGETHMQTMVGCGH